MSETEPDIYSLACEQKVCWPLVSRRSNDSKVLTWLVNVFLGLFFFCLYYSVCSKKKKRQNKLKTFSTIHIYENEETNDGGGEAEMS